MCAACTRSLGECDEADALTRQAATVLRPVAPSSGGAAYDEPPGAEPAVRDTPPAVVDLPSAAAYDEHSAAQTVLPSADVVEPPKAMQTTPAEQSLVDAMVDSVVVSAPVVQPHF